MATAGRNKKEKQEEGTSSPQKRRVKRMKSPILAAGAAALCLLAALVLVTSDADARLVPAALLGKTQFLAGGLEVYDKKEGSGEAATAGKTVKVIDGRHVLARTHACMRLLTQSRSRARAHTHTHPHPTYAHVGPVQRQARQRQGLRLGRHRVPLGRGSRHQGVGHGRCRHEGRRGAQARDPTCSCLRRRGHAWWPNSPERAAHLRCQAPQR